MYEVAEAAAHATLAAVETAAGLAEVGDRGELAVDGAAGVPARVQGIAGFLGVVFIFEARVYVADEVCGKWRLVMPPSVIWARLGKLTVIVVVADDDFLDLAVLAHLAPEILVEGVEVVL
jgi:hypothetical protein